MDATEIGKRLVELTTSDRDEQAIEELYDQNIVSVEAANGSDGEAQTWEGVDAVREKHAWWNGVTTLHSMKAEGPYSGAGDNHFVVKFWMDITMDGQDREQITEVGLFEVANGKITREVYLPLNA